MREQRKVVPSSSATHDEALELLEDALKLVEPIDFLELKGYAHDVLW